MGLKKASQEDPYRLDPKQFPRRIELELSEEVLEAMQKLANETGRSVSEIATDILSRDIEEHPPSTTD
jgi:predicted DNA-binding protein